MTGLSHAPDRRPASDRWQPRGRPARLPQDKTYEWLGLELLRRAWIKVDLIWTVALAAAGAILLVSS
jgi:hypothetical protein